MNGCIMHGLFCLMHLVFVFVTFGLGLVVSIPLHIIATILNSKGRPAPAEPAPAEEEQAALNAALERRSRDDLSRW